VLPLRLTLIVSAIVDLLLNHGCIAEEHGATAEGWSWFYSLSEDHVETHRIHTMAWQTPISCSMPQSDREMVQTLLVYGAYVEIGGCCPLINAAGDIAIFRSLFERISISYGKKLF
jgi:hypothetical protein